MALERRHFLLAPALAAQAARAQADAVPTAVIGVGNRGSHLLKGVLEQPNARVLAVCDIKPDRLDKAATAAASHKPSTTNDWRKIIDRKDIAAVFVATPPHLHSEMAVAALQAGKHVYCEKPIGVTAPQVKAVVEAARRSKSVFVPGQQLRSFLQLQEAIGKLRSGVAGDILMVKAQRQADRDLPHDGSSGDWYFDVTKSGGYLIEQSVHNLDVCNWAIGALPVKAAGFGATVFYKNDPPGRTIYDCGSITYEYPKGVSMTFTQNVFHPRGMPLPGQCVHIFGSKGAVDLMYDAKFYPMDRSEPVVLAEKRQEAQHGHITAFYDSVTKGAPLPADIKIGASAALTAILGHEAMRQQRVVTWKELGVEL